MNPLRFLGYSLKRLREFPGDAKQDAGYRLDRVQRGGQPSDLKPMPSAGVVVEEIRLRNSLGLYRVIRTARLADAVYELHCFQKKTQMTARADLDLAATRYAELTKGAK